MGLSLVASTDLGALVDRFVGSRAPSDDPLAREVVVVPNVVVGQWFEQAVATRTGQPGRGDGVAANLDLIFLRGLVGLALYGDAGALDAWSAPVLAVAIHGADPATSMRQALHRGAALARLVELRGDELDSLLAGDDRAAERRVVAQRAAEGRLTPRAHFDAHGVSGAPSRLALFHCVASPFDALGPQVVRAIADRAPVAHYLGVAARELFDDEGQRPLDERSLLERWGAPSAAHLRLWRENAAPDEEHWVDVVDLPERAAVLSALSSREPPAATTHPTAFVEVHATVGLSRQVEVARDAVLAAMEEFSLAAHDVRIVASDARATVPLLGALWQPSSLEEPGSPRVQYEIADPRVPRRSLRLDAFTRLLRALDSDATAHDMAALLTAPALRDGLGLTSDEAERALRLARDGRVSVGLDADDLARRGVFEDDDDAGSWRRLVDRIAMASFFDADEGVVDVAPLGVAEDRTVATKLAVLIDALADGARRARATRALAEWASLFVDLARLIEHDERVRDPSLDRVLGDFDALAGNATRATVFAEARDLVESLAERAGGSSLFGRGGAVLVNPAAAGMLPFEVTCVVGLDEENMPDPSGRVTELGPTRPTDPDARAGLRAGLLDVLASTRRRVIFLTSDRRAVDGAVLEPALVLAELTDALSAVGHHLVATTRRHPRHGFSTAGVDGDLDVAAAGARAFSFDPVHAMAADVAARGAATPDDDLPLVTVTTASRVEGPVEIDEITQFLRNPQRVFLSDAFGSARVVETSVAERAEAPLLSAGSPLELYPWRESTLRRAVATGEEPSAPDGPDSVVGTVATGYRARAVAELHLDALALFARTLREGFAAAGAVRREEFASPSIVAGFVRDVARGPLEVYDTRRGPALVEFTSSHGYGWRLLGLLVRQAVATAELGRPVSAVLLRGLDNHEAKNPDRRPYLVATWSDPDPVAAARHLVNAVIDLYDKRLERLPLHTNTTSLATDDRLGPGRAKAVKSPALEWLSRGFRGQRDTGESQSPENRLLLPLTYAELRAVRGGGFVEQSAQLTSAVAGVEVTTVVGITPWIDYLPEPAGG